MSEDELRAKLGAWTIEHEARIRTTEMAIADLKPAVDRLQRGLIHLQVGFGVFGALWLWIEVRPFFGG